MFNANEYSILLHNILNIVFPEYPGGIWGKFEANPESEEQFGRAMTSLDALGAKAMVADGPWCVPNAKIVHFNLFCGTVLALGGPDQIALLHAFQKKGCLGCFGLTEKFAGLLNLMLRFSTYWSYT